MEKDSRDRNWGGLMPQSQKSGSEYVLAAVILWIFDFAYLSFGGLNIEAMLENISDVGYIAYVAVRSPLLISILAIYFFTRIHKVSNKDEFIDEFLSFFAFVFMVWISIVLGGLSPGVLIHTGFAIFIWLLLRRDIDISPASKAVAVGVFFDFFGHGILTWLGEAYDISLLSTLGNTLYVPVWLLFSLFLVYNSAPYRDVKKFWVVRILTWGIIGLYVFSFANVFVTTSAFTKDITPEEKKDAIESAKIAWENFKRFGFSFMSSTSKTSGNFLEGFIKMGAGEFYPGNKEDTEPVGIFLKVMDYERDVTPDSRFLAEVSATTLGIEESIPVSSSCFWEDADGNKQEGEIIPSQKRIGDGDSTTFSCTFSNISTEADKVTFEAVASGLKAVGEMSVFFMDENLRPFIKSEKGASTYPGSVGPNVKSSMIYTNGPLTIETIKLTQPIAIAEDDVVDNFGVLFKNGWTNGEISSIKKVELMLPEGIELSKCQITPTYEQRTDSQTGETRNVYTFDTSAFEPLKKVNDELAYLICVMTVKSGKKDYLTSGAMNIAPRYFFISAEYDFKTTGSISITVAGHDENNGESDACEDAGGSCMEGSSCDEGRTQTTVDCPSGEICCKSASYSCPDPDWCKTECSSSETNTGQTCPSSGTSSRKCCKPVSACAAGFECKAVEQGGCSEGETQSGNCIFGGTLPGVCCKPVDACAEGICKSDCDSDEEDVGDCTLVSGVAYGDCCKPVVVCGADGIGECIIAPSCHNYDLDPADGECPNANEACCRRETPENGPTYATKTAEEREIRDKIVAEANDQDVPWKNALGLAYTECGGKITGCGDTSSAGAVGLFQIIPRIHAISGGTCEGMDLGDMDQNIRCGIMILKSYYRDYCKTYECTEAEYCGWDIAARKYVGWAPGGGCDYIRNTLCGGSESCTLRYFHYVELVKCFIEQFNKPDEIRYCVVESDGRVHY